MIVGVGVTSALFHRHYTLERDFVVRRDEKKFKNLIVYVVRLVLCTNMHRGLMILRTYHLVSATITNCAACAITTPRCKVPYPSCYRGFQGYKRFAQIRTNSDELPDSYTSTFPVYYAASYIYTNDISKYISYTYQCRTRIYSNLKRIARTEVEAFSCCTYNISRASSTRHLVHSLLLYDGTSCTARQSR
jgi:hypothetical protein